MLTLRTSGPIDGLVSLIKVRRDREHMAQIGSKRRQRHAGEEEAGSYRRLR
jgi:hypothetical protein